MRVGSKVGLVAVLAFSLGGCVSNPADVANTLNTVNSVVSTAQQVKNPGAAGMGAAGVLPGAVGQADPVAAMRDAPNDPRYKRAEQALRQTSLLHAKCKDLQSRQQTVIDSIAEIEPLTGNLMFKQQYERLTGKRDAMVDIAKSKRCKLPTVAAATTGASSGNAGAAGGAGAYAAMNCKSLKEEYAKVNAAAAEGVSPAQAAQQVQSAAAGATQLASLVPGAGGILGAVQQINQAANTAGNIAAATGAAPVADHSQQKSDIESAAKKKRCRLDA